MTLHAGSAVAAAARQRRGTAVWAVADCGGPIAGRNRPAPTTANRVRSTLAGHCSVCSMQTVSRRGEPCRPTDRHPVAIGQAVWLGAVVCKQQARSPRLAGCARRSWAAEPTAGQGGQKSGAFDHQPAVNVSASPRNSNFDPWRCRGPGCNADSWPLDPSSPSKNAGIGTPNLPKEKTGGGGSEVRGHQPSTGVEPLPS